MSDTITKIDGKFRVKRICELCKNEFQILNNKSKKTICPECKKKILLELPLLIIERNETRKKAEPLDDTRRKFDWELRTATDDYKQKIHHEHSELCSKAYGLWQKICEYRKLLKKYYDVPKLMAKPEDCNHNFDDLKLISANGENPTDSCRVEYWATVFCLRCGTELHFHNRVS